MICPHLKFPKRSTLRRQVEQRFEELQKCVNDELKNCSSKISFTIDGWTSVANRTFYGVTAHYIDNEWNYQSLVLDFIPSNGKHTGKDIATIFHKCLLEYNLETKIQGITVVNAAANTTFMHELQKLLDFDSENQHFRCIAHILNLGVQSLMKNLEIPINEDDREDGSEDEDEFEEERDDGQKETLDIDDSTTSNYYCQNKICFQ